MCLLAPGVAQERQLERLNIPSISSRLLCTKSTRKKHTAAVFTLEQYFPFLEKSSNVHNRRKDFSQYISLHDPPTCTYMHLATKVKATGKLQLLPISKFESLKVKTREY